MGVANNIFMLIVGRAITGIAAGTWVLLVVAFSSLFPSEDVVRVTAMLTLAGSIGRVLATSVTGSLNNLGGYSLAFFLATGAAGLAILVVLPVHEQRRVSQRPSIERFGKLVKSRDVLVPSLLSAIFQHAIWSSSYGFIPIMARQLGASDVLQSMLISMNIAVVALGNVMTATLGGYIGVRRIVYLSFGLMSGGIIAAAMASTLFPVFVAQFCTGLAGGLGYPVLMGMSIKRVADAERATAMGLHQAIYGIGMFSGPWLSGILSDVIGIQATFGITALICLILGVFGTRWLPNTRKGRNILD
jgi:MFS family permease